MRRGNRIENHTEPLYAMFLRREIGDPQFNRLPSEAKEHEFLSIEVPPNRTSDKYNQTGEVNGQDYSYERRWMGHLQKDHRQSRKETNDTDERNIKRINVFIIYLRFLFTHTPQKLANLRWKSTIVYRGSRITSWMTNLRWCG